MSSSDRLHERLRQMKARVAIQQWEARQIGHARGVWFRLQLLLAQTKRALVITAEEASVLRNAGLEPQLGQDKVRPLCWTIPVRKFTNGETP